MALFDWPIVFQYDVKAKYRLISRKFSGMEVFSPVRSRNQLEATRVCIRSINQSISVRLLFVFYSRVFISRSYENRSNVNLRPGLWRTSVERPTSIKRPLTGTPGGRFMEVQL